MPGRTPAEAFRAFIEPLESAVSVLGAAKITVSSGGRQVPDKPHAWTLNGGRGYTTGGWFFEADMQYRIRRDDAPGRGPWRVTTLAYRYRLAVVDMDVFRMHWHPDGNSPAKSPHLHVRLAPVERVGDTLQHHLNTERQTFENALRWAIQVGMPPARSDWSDLLDQAEAAHLRHRSWS